MKLLINIFGSLVMTVAILALMSVGALVEYLALHVNWPLVFVLAFSALILVTFLKKRKTYNDHG